MLTVPVLGGQIAHETEVGWVQTLRDLSARVSQTKRATFEARVMLGHVLLKLREEYAPRDFQRIREAAGIHRRRVSEALRLAEAFARADGAVDWDKYNQVLSDDRAEARVEGRASAALAEPSVRQAIAALQVAPSQGPSAEDDGVVEEVVIIDDDDEDDGSVIVEDDEDLAAPAAAPAAVPVVHAGPADRGASGIQMELGALYDEARALSARLGDVLRRLGFSAQADEVIRLTGGLPS